MVVSTLLYITRYCVYLSFLSQQIVNYEKV